MKAYAAWPVVLSLLVAGCKHQPKQDNQKANKEVSARFVTIIPYRGFDKKLMPDIIAAVKDFYSCNVHIQAETTLPAFAWYAPRLRYKADSLLLFQQQLHLKNTDAIAGLTASDISTRNGAITDWGVFGLGLHPGNSCIISSYRLNTQGCSIALFKERLIKVVLHELGHNFGLPHCKENSHCLMNDAKGTIAQVDKEQKWLCPKCRSLLPN